MIISKGLNLDEEGPSKSLYLMQTITLICLDLNCGAITAEKSNHENN